MQWEQSQKPREKEASPGVEENDGKAEATVSKPHPPWWKSVCLGQNMQDPLSSGTEPGS